ncbi:MAG: ribonucleoside-diphosphate reductase subunit alpha [Candidatus Dormibacteria bacterium]
MRVRKRDGTFEPVDVNKIVRAVARCSEGLGAADPRRVALKTISGLYDGATTAELDRLSIQTAAGLIAEEPQYSRLAARLLGTYIDKEVRGQGLHSFSQSIAAGHAHGIISERVATFVRAASRKLDDAVEPARIQLFEYFGVRTVYDRYLLRHPSTRQVIETPQYFFLRVACGLAETVAEAVELYRLMSSLAYLPSSPTLFNSGTQHSQLSSCYLIDSPADDLIAIYDTYSEVARLSKFAGGIGLAYSRVRSRGSLIRGTNGRSNGIVPFLKTLDASVAAVNQGGRRKGAACVYLEPWHADVEDFLELRDNTGDDSRRTHNLNLANWIPDLFMRRVEADQPWSLFDPHQVPELPDLWGEAFDRAYIEAEAAGRFVRQVPARELYARMLRTLAQTGNGWMTFKDACNRTSNQTAVEGNVIHLSNLCTEILEVTSDAETAVCNLGSVNLGAFVSGDGVDMERLRHTVHTAVTFLDRVIDINLYPTPRAAASNPRWRPVGLGVMGLQDVFFKLRLPFDSPRARELSRRLAEEVYHSALSASCDLAERNGAHPAFAETRAAAGVLQPDLWPGTTVTDPARWSALRERIARHGLRNSLLIAVAPTATIASIAGCYECIEPQVANVFKRETLSGEFMQVNPYLVHDLKERGVWNETVRAALKRAEGSIQDIAEIPADLKAVYRTVWEIPMRSLIDMAAERGPFIDQSQSLNLFMADPTIGKLSSMYAYAWKSGLKTTYYLRSRPATRIKQTTVAPLSGAASPSLEAGVARVDGDGQTDDAAAAALACSLENPETCEACQ